MAERIQKRDREIHFVMSPDEVDRMKEKMAGMGIRSQSAYLRKMALDGYCINLDLSDLTAVRSLLRSCSNNLNQYAKRANETGSIYAEDIQDLRRRQEKIWQQLKEILGTLAAIR